MNNKDKELIINEIRKNKPLFDLDDNFMLYITKGYNNLYDKINTSSFKEILECNDCSLLCELLSKYSLDIDDDILIEMALADINLMEGYESIPLINHLDLFDERIKYKLLNEERYILRLLSSFPDSSFDVSICELKQYYSKINYILKRSKKFILKAIARCDLVYLCLDNDIRNDMEFISEMLMYNPSMLKILDIKYQRDINFIVHVIKNMNNNYNSIYNLLMYYKVGDILKIRDKFINNKEMYDLIDEILVIKQRDEYLELDIPF